MKFINKGNRIDTDKIHKRFELIISQAGHSTYDAASILGISQPAIHTYCKGRRKITIEMAAKISKAYDIDFVWLITGLKLSDYKM